MELTMLGTGNAVLHQLKYAGFDWKDMKEIFVTHKHIDHLMGIIWMVRMICQNMASGQYEGEVNIYAHEEVIELIHNMAENLLQKKSTKYKGDFFRYWVHKGKTVWFLYGTGEWRKTDLLWR